MATQQARTENLLYLEHITALNVLNREYTLRLFVENDERELHTNDNRTWTPAQRLDISPTSKMRAEIHMRSGHLIWAKNRQASDVINLQALLDDYWTSTKPESTVPRVIVIGKHRWSIEFRFSANATAEALRLSLHELEGLLKEYAPLISGSTERAMEKSMKYGAVLAELNPIAKAIFGVASVTFQLLTEQNKYDQLPSGLLDRMRRILPLADKVADEIICEEPELLERIIQRMFEVMHRVAKFSCDYVKHARTIGGPAYQETIEEMDRDLTKAIEDFSRAVDVEALLLAKKIEQQLLLDRLKPLDAGYDFRQCCMEGTRQSILNRIMAWVPDTQEGNTYWLYGSPGIGKTSLAHSICKELHKRKCLAGAFFCRRDDPNLSDPKYILPTFINTLSGILPRFRSIVTARLRSDPNLTSKSMEHSLFLDFIYKLPHHPEHALVFVIDALDECGDDESRPDILEALTHAAAQAPWLRIIITSRPEVDIQRFFDTSTRTSHLRYDLAMDEEANTDIRIFAQRQFDLVASKWYLHTPWPKQSLFDRVISRANGLFVFIKTAVLALDNCTDPTESLEATVQDSDGTGLNSLYLLYSGILKKRVPSGNAEFQRVIGVILTTAPYRPLCDEAIAELTGVRSNLVKKWVDDLSSLLYRDEAAKGGIRVRHLSISDFFFNHNSYCDYQVNLRDANMELGITCLKTMVNQLRFNICKLEDSRLANADVKDLQSRIEQNIPDALQYSSRYWSYHLCFSPDTGDQRVWASLEGFIGGLYPLFWVEVLSIMGMVPIGAPSLRVVVSWAKDTDSTIIKKIQDICRFIITFHTPISISTPHTYLSTLPFLPSQSYVSATFTTRFTKSIKMKSGKLLSWPAPPLEWIGHSNTVGSVCYSPDGRHIISGSLDRTIRIWDMETGDAVGEPLQGHTGTVTSVAWSPDGQHIISGSSDRTIRIWDAGTGAAVGLPLEGHTGDVWSVAYTPNGRHIISGSDDRTIRIWDAKTGAVVGKPLTGHSQIVWSVALSPDGQHIASGSTDRTIRIWDAKTGAAVGEPLKGCAGEVLSVAYSPDGHHIISGSSDMTIRIWDTGIGTSPSKSLNGHTSVVRSVAYSPNGQRIISGSRDLTVRIWDAETGAMVGKPLGGHTGHVNSVAYSPDGQHIISGSQDSSIRIWNAETGAAVGNPQEEYLRRVVSVAYSPNGRHIISGSRDHTIRIWDAETGAIVGKPLEGHTSHVQSVAYSPNGQYIISGSRDSTIRIWDAGTGAAVGKPLEGHTDHVLSVAVSPDGQHIISGSVDKTIRIWDAKTGAIVGEPLIGHLSVVRSITYSPNEWRIASGSADCTIRIWDTETRSMAGKPLTGHSADVYSVAFSPDGQCIVSGSSDRTIQVWNVKTGAAVGKPLQGHTDTVLCVAYSPDGQHIISGSRDRTIRIWNAKTGDAVGKPLMGHSDIVQSVAFSPNKRHIVSGSSDSSIRVWDASLHVSAPLRRTYGPLYSQLCAPPDTDGWVRDLQARLLYWVPPDCRAALHPPALLTISLTPHIRSVSLDFEDFAFATSWTQILSSA